MTHRSLLLVLAVTALLAASVPAYGARSGPTAVTALAGLETRVLDELNDVRREHGLRELRSNGALAAAARAHSFDMIEQGYFSHTSADGTAYWARIAREYPRAGHRQYAVSENLLYASPTISARGAIRVWMNSPGHRRAILTPEWREIGVSAAATRSGPGQFAGAAVTVITLDFGVRR